ncbi:hypothetical protein NVSP9465_03927 [Novosphingobium sp. CECT 9465]|nr:hypothetical protein [Novosphingobium sp. CECT 9465]CAH0498833.1 hypothetical protein NVSP9465_03927 [Novosphingobium sp. CECT 9465]
MAIETAQEGQKTVVAAPEATLPVVGASADIAWTIVQMRAGERITVNEALIAAYQGASSPHSIRALKSDVEAFDAWCRAHQPDRAAGDGRDRGRLSRRAGREGEPAGLAIPLQGVDRQDPPAARAQGSDAGAAGEAAAPDGAPREGAAQKQARPLRFKGPVRDVERDKARGLNIRALLESCGEDLPGLRDRALLSAAYDTGLRASELVAVAIEHIEEAIDPKRGCCRFLRHKGDQDDGEGGDRLPQPAHRRGDRGVDRSGGDHDRAAVPAGAGAALQGAGSRARSADTASRAGRRGICARRCPSRRGEGARRI